MRDHCVCLEGCEGAVFSYSPWEYKPGPLNLLLCRGDAETVEGCPSGVRRVACSGMYAVPCPFDAVIVAAGDGRRVEWYDELFAEPGVVDEELLEVHSSLGFCGGLVYGRLESAKPGYMEAGVIVEPDGSVVELGSGPVVAAVAVSRRSVYSFRSRTGRFPVEWLREKGLLSGKTVVVGSWVASWEVRLLHDAGALLAVAPASQALHRGGPPPRPQYRGVVALASGGLLDTPWLLAYTAMVEYAAVYWGLVDPEDILAGLVRGWRLAGLEPRLGRVPVALVEARGFRGDPRTLILSRPVHRASVWPGVGSGGEGEAEATQS